MQDIIECADIIEVIERLEPGHVLTNCRDRNGYALKYFEYEWIQAADGTMLMIEKNDKGVFYRGENKVYASCKAGLYRRSSRADQIISLLKTYDFMLFLCSQPEVQLYKLANLYFDPWAIAQHYEFITPMLDLTNDIAVAAFFATHYYDNRIKRYQLVKSGVGQIRYIEWNPSLNGELRPIGQQPYARPGRQDGYAYWLPAGEDFADCSYCLQFHQDYAMNLKLERAMLGGEENYFPYEQINQMAAVIRNEKIVSQKAIQAFMSDVESGNSLIFPKVKREEIMSVLRDNHVFITDAELVCTEAVPPRISAFIPIRRIVTRPAWLNKNK